MWPPNPQKWWSTLMSRLSESTLFPYTTLFRSARCGGGAGGLGQAGRAGSLSRLLPAHGLRQRWRTRPPPSPTQDPYAGGGRGQRVQHGRLDPLHPFIEFFVGEFFL